MSRALKRFAEQALITTGFERFARRRLRERILVLAYHNILPQGERSRGDSSLHLSQREFGNQLDALAESHEVVALETLLSGQPGSGASRVVITFDDAYVGAVTVGVEELRKRKMPATIFVAPGLLGTVPWWDVLAQSNRGAVRDDLRRRALDVLAGDAEAILRSVESQSHLPARAKDLPRISTESELAGAVTTPGITLGSHSWSHRNLTALPEAELESELLRPLQWLKTRFNTVVPCLSYPYGLFNEAAQRSAAKAGYLAAFRIDGGWLPRSVPLPSYALPRFNIPSGLSLDGFRLRLAGVGSKR
jgi:peptidoglycan/xylan/chitin deacetylase (PgdA/CDA1 family)